MTDNDAFFQTENTDEETQGRTHAVLQQHGWAPADDRFSGPCAALLRGFLRQDASTDLATLLPRAQEFVDRPRPFLPSPSQSLDPSRVIVYDPGRTVIWVDPKRIFPSPGREFQDRGDWTEAEEPTEFRNEPVLGLAEFARRIATERGDLAGLTRLLGPEGEAAHVDLDAWETPLGAFFRVNINGNHRSTAFAILGAPCIPATVQWHLGPFHASASMNAADDELLYSYRALLHSYGVASYPDPEDIGTYDDRIFSDWPFLIDSADSAVQSLAVMEQTVGRRHYAPIGRLPREVFDDADALIAAGKRTRKVLERNQRWIETGGFRELLRAAVSGR
ncbi:hypothetical protein [Microbacterium lacticum]